MTGNDIWGLEFDWYASDRDGHVALLSTAGNGLVPPDILRSIAEMDLLSEHFRVPSPTRSFWEEFAELGLFVYDCGSLHDGTYRRQAAPQRPLFHDALTGRIGRAVSIFRFSGLCFAETDAIDGRMLLGP